MNANQGARETGVIIRDRVGLQEILETLGERALMSGGTLMRPALTVAVMLVTAACASSAPNDEQNVRDAVASFVRGLENLDAAAAVAPFSDDATVFSAASSRRSVRVFLRWAADPRARELPVGIRILALEIFRPTVVGW